VLRWRDLQCCCFILHLSHFLNLVTCIILWILMVLILFAHYFVFSPPIIYYIRGGLVSNAHSEIFFRRGKVAMRAQCVLVATTLLHRSAKFHSFIYTGSKTVRVNVKSCYGGMSTRLKQRALTEFLSAKNITPAEIHRRLQAVYGEDTVNRNSKSLGH